MYLCSIMYVVKIWAVSTLVLLRRNSLRASKYDFRLTEEPSNSQVTNTHGESTKEMPSNATNAHNAPVH